MVARIPAQLRQVLVCSERGKPKPVSGEFDPITPVLFCAVERGIGFREETFGHRFQIRVIAIEDDAGDPDGYG
jgi:hypothetical protein